ncbi:hypothetical protein HYY69_01710 [Candidatus Woesearchaeota archaeon]|nr:hypothetical protein [Candidatus Woesearchaeota archaeon]
MSKLIEIVSDFHTGAEVAQCIGDVHIRDQHLGDKVTLASSGLLIEIPDDAWNYDLVCYIFDHARVFSQVLKPDRERYDSDLDYRTDINQRAKEQHQTLLGINITHRLEFHRILNSPLSFTPKQTEVRDGVALVLGLREEHVLRAEQLYNGANSHPKIVSLPDYLLGIRPLPNLEEQSINRVGRDYIDILRTAIPQAIDKFVSQQHP